MKNRGCAAIACMLAAAGCTRSGEVLRPADGAAPVVLQLTDVRVAGGFGHACAVTAGVLHCWGDDGDGRLGVAGPGGDAGTAQAPVTVAGGPWIAPATGSSHTCALAAGASVSFFVRVLGGRRASLAVGAGAGASWLSFRAEPVPGYDALSYANLLAEIGRAHV